MKFVINFVKKRLKKHKYPEAVLIHKPSQGVVYEIQKNYYDLDLKPVSLVLEYGGTRVLTISEIDMLEYREYTGNLNGEIIEI